MIIIRMLFVIYGIVYIWYVVSDKLWHDLPSQPAGTLVLLGISHAELLLLSGVGGL
jgi:hypothetical protein